MRCFFCREELHATNEAYEMVCCKARWDYEKALARQREHLKHLTDANRESQHITGDDLNIRVGGPHCA